MPLKRFRREVWSLLPAKKKVPPGGVPAPAPQQSVSSETGQPAESRPCLSVLKAASQSLLLSPRLQVKFVSELKTIVDMPPPGKKKVQETFIFSNDEGSKPPTSVSNRSLSSKVTTNAKESPAAFEARTGLKASSLTNLNTTTSEHYDKKTSKKPIQEKCSLKKDRDVVPVISETKIPLQDEHLRDHNRISEDSDNEEDFDKQYRNDHHFVVAKFVVRRKIGFNIDKNSNVSGFRKKMLRVLEQADIMKLRSVLAGDSVYVPKHFKLPEEDVKPPRLESNVLDSGRVDQQVTLLDSNGNSPDMSLDEIDVKPPEDRPDNMPVLSSMMESPDKVQVKEGDQKMKPSSVTRKRQLLESKFYSSRPPPLPMFPVQKISFKIPRQKVCTPKWIRNGKLWQWALTVDDNGQFSMCSGGRKKVPSARKLNVRPCEEFETWLKRGTFTEGDSVVFSMDLEEKKDAHYEKLRRREEIEWKEKVMDRILGVRQHQKEPDATFGHQDTGFDPGIEMDDFGHIEDGLEDAGTELVEEELETSQESLVTHIRTPPHVFVFENIDVGNGGDAGDEAAARLSQEDPSSPSSVASQSTFINLPSPPNSERGAQAPHIVTQNIAGTSQQHIFGVNTLESRPTSSWRDLSVSSLSGLLNRRHRLKLKM